MSILALLCSVTSILTSTQSHLINVFDTIAFGLEMSSTQFIITNMARYLLKLMLTSLKHARSRSDKLSLYL